MIHARRLLTALLLGASLTVAAGCGSGDSHGAQSAVANDGTPSVATANAVKGEPAAAVDSSATQPALNDANPVDAAATVATIPAPGATGGEVAVGQPAAAGPDVTSETSPAAGANDPAGALIAAVGTTDVAASTPAPAAGPRVPKLLIPEKSFRHEGDALRVSYDDLDLLKVLNMEPVTPKAPDMFPQWLKDLEGHRIRIRGYMRPGELSEGLPFFVLARDTNACCFGPNTKAYDIIPVIMREGVTTDYIHMQPFDIVGVFHTGVEMDFANPDKVEFLYRIEDAVLIRKTDAR